MVEKFKDLLESLEKATYVMEQGAGVERSALKIEVKCSCCDKTLAVFVADPAHDHVVISVACKSCMEQRDQDFMLGSLCLGEAFDRGG